MKILIALVLVALSCVVQAQPNSYGLMCTSKSNSVAHIAFVISNKSVAYLHTKNFNFKGKYFDKFKFEKLALTHLLKHPKVNTHLYSINNVAYALQVLGTDKNAVLYYSNKEYKNCVVLKTKQINSLISEGESQADISNKRVKEKGFTGIKKTK